ncbi:ribosomal-protein-alanine N-acetyltransferase [Paenibacillus anaericanus]|uniref:GNAT family N-acetyltransferase n=1 Tax=Paenibacillus anaericanus TaxID=170367 RepID=UPI00278937F4|nr:GNAT family N-acetyltransferase [Paenibacillus anaericanus]MDQ0087899.1 ribosomal-protein-alanine N-acetyltransferase [Paenibacillus anaericanus]
MTTYTLRTRTIEDVHEFINWTFEGIYSFYDNNIQEEKIAGFYNSVDSERAFSVINEHDELIGNCEFYDVGDDGEEILAVGVQMKPSLTGKGTGFDFVNTILEQGRVELKYNYLELAVVDFNQRAMRLYENVGFRKIGEFENNIRGNTYQFIKMAKDWA